MQKNAATETHRTVGVEPPIEPHAAWRVREVRIIEHGLLEVRFADGTQGMVDMQQRLYRADVAGTIFEPLRDPMLFAQATVHLGAIEWPGEIDLAPDAMYDQILAHGTWTLD